MEFQRSIRKALIREAFMSNASWAIIGGSVAACIGLQDPFVLLIGAALEGAAVLWMLNSQKFIRRVLGKFTDAQEQKKQMRLEEIIKQSDPEVRARYQEILKSAEEIEDLTQNEDSAFLTTGLTSTISQLQTLRDKSASLLEKRLLIRKFLANIDIGALERDCQKQERAIATMQDPISKKQYLQSLNLKRQQLETCRTMFVALQRIDGQLEQIASTLSSLKGKIVLLKTSEVTTAGGYEKMGDELKDLIGDVQVMEDSVEEAASFGTVPQKPPQKIMQ